MSSVATPGGFEDTDRHVVHPDANAIEAILADFRDWLTQATDAQAPPPAATVDLFTLVSQFVALRHEVNMQTRSVRGAVEQNAELLQRLQAVSSTPDSSEALRPVAKALIDIADALTLSMRQMAKFGETADALLIEPPRPTGFFARLFQSPAPPPDLTKLKQLVAAGSDGYTLSIRRIERLFSDLGLEPIDCVGSAFDPETMEAVEVAGDSGAASGTVLEAVRPGYLWRGKVFRFAQVKVAR